MDSIMFMLAFHIVAVGALVMMVWAIAYAQGRRAGERHLRRRLGLAEDAGLQASESSASGQ
jgi:membrane protein DedA with SNARE-associated domain